LLTRTTGRDVLRESREKQTKRLLLRDDDPARPVPDVTFSDAYTLEVGGERVELAWHGPTTRPTTSTSTSPTTTP
jgi:hypothetical protein